jgi:hypothetical protein
MFVWCIQVLLLSILFIFLIHYLLDFFMKTLTVPKVKDILNNSNNKYREILETLKNNENVDYSAPLLPSNANITQSYSEIDILPSFNTKNNFIPLIPSISFEESLSEKDSLSENNMRNELKSFVKTELQK